MELRQLRYFCQTCAKGTVTAAAADLYVTEQTISYALKKLEAELGCALFVRSKQGVAPTPEGRVLYEKALALLEMADDITATVGRERELRGTVRFRICTMAVPERGAFSLAAVDDFRHAYPQVEVSLIECPTRNCIRALIEDTADLAFVYSAPRSPELECHLLREGEIVMALASDHPLAARDELRIADLKGQTILHAGNGGQTFRVLEERCRALGFEPTYQMTSSQYFLDAAASGQGLAPALAGHPLLDVRPGIVTRRFAAEDRITAPLTFAVRRSLPAASPARALMDWLLTAWGEAGE